MQSALCQLCCSPKRYADVHSVGQTPVPSVLDTHDGPLTVTTRELHSLHLKDKSYEAWLCRINRRKLYRASAALSATLLAYNPFRQVPCTVVNLSSGGAGIVYEGFLPPREPIVMYIEGFGRIPAVAVAPIPGGSRLRFQCTTRKSAQIERRLIRLTNNFTRPVQRPSKGFTDEVETNSLVSCPAGASIDWDVLDLSLDGATLRTSLRPPIGEEIKLGPNVARVAWHHEEGFGVKFLRQSATVRGLRAFRREVNSTTIVKELCKSVFWP